MAISMTSEGGAPENFHISFGNDDDDSNMSSGSMRCPLCSYSKRHFYCRSCIRNGDFLHSSHHLLERFSDKQSRYKNLKSAHNTLENKCVHLFSRRRLSCQLRAEIKQKSENIDNIRKLMVQKRENVLRLQSRKKELLESNRMLRMKLPRCDDKVKVIGDYVLSKLEESERRRGCLADLQSKLKQLKRDNIEKLIKYIFPVSQAISNKSSFSSSDGESKNTINEISEATRTAYVRGKWILQDSFGEIQHIIVAPALPGNGNYSAYNDWATVNPATEVSSVGKTEDPTKNMASRNPAHTIAAALTYTTQLTQIISFYLDIRLPYKVSYNDFCTTALSEAHFNRKVARLNANILYLCYTQGCRLVELRPTHTLENVQRLLNASHADLGRLGPMDRNFCLNEQTDTALTQYLGTGEDSDSDGEGNIQHEWEAVPSNLPPPGEADALHIAGTIGTSALPYSNTHRYQTHHHLYNQHHHPVTTTSLMTSAVASVTSLWKGWTGK
ncbi:beclin 1-associated autophagy-related key regulator [Malaya genurostris]|uniref:beclin 1-associated autophagy-related key regulator n=1 Tax=Malaya genurostris TaxID=325434 RepID=UPI0026F3B8FC|nr:beclin 1-associated autophagy-related key regulator [Malaya genurostris]XP_058466031.1 beclin 1-associated autophagy-related key regulator [Malaya genurostris]XP_058466033.1 beclin 1-associated autophagy-related key regulator [Malaya genurostris]XP_058466034.1 beclin 1-associated autophagy-related key regulator [Malaya genurostris]XP_058466035.1 beclin 1-associated autophagy-related key regulator [Malaya genurostris]